MMKYGTTKSFAPLHLVVLSTGNAEELRGTVECIRDGAGYPHALTVLELTGTPEIREYLQEMQEQRIVQNVVISGEGDAGQAAVSVPVEVLGLVDAPYTVVITAGVNMHRVGWLRRILGTMLRSEAPAIGCNGAPDPERAVAPLASRELLQEYIFTPGHTVAITRAELEGLGAFTSQKLNGLRMPVVPQLSGGQEFFGRC